jgi:hypothetical protein
MMTTDPVDNAHQRIASLREEEQSLEERLQEIHGEINKWEIFVERWNLLHDESIEQGPGQPLLKKGTIATTAARIMLHTPEYRMTVQELELELPKHGVAESANFRTAIYTALKRREDVFEKTGPGEFRLRTTEFVFED